MILEEATPPTQAEEQQDTKGAEPPAVPGSQVSEVEIPSVGKILVRSDADGYNEEVPARVPVCGCRVSMALGAGSSGLHCRSCAPVLLGAAPVPCRSDVTDLLCTRTPSHAFVEWKASPAGASVMI